MRKEYTSNNDKNDKNEKDMAYGKKISDSQFRISIIVIIVFESKDDLAAVTSLASIHISIDIMGFAMPKTIVRINNG